MHLLERATKKKSQGSEGNPAMPKINLTHFLANNAIASA